MSANTLNNRSIGQTILDTFFNDIHSALDGDFVGRGATGIPTSGQNLGTLALPWGALYCNSINLGGSALDTSKIVSPSNRIVSGKVRSTSNQPAFLTPNGAAASVLIAGNTTNLVLSIGGVAVTVNTDITKGSLTTAPSSQNTATVNDSTASGQADTKRWGEYWGKKITMTSAGTNITSLVGKFAVFKHSTEYFVAFVESSTILSHCLRGYFYDSSLNPLNPTGISNSDTLTLMKAGFVFMTNDATTVDVSYTFPTYAASAPGSPATGDYWYDTVNQIWKRYDGASFQIINRTLIGMVVMDSTNCVAARSFDFYAAYDAHNTIDVEIGTTVTNAQARRAGTQVSVAGKLIDFGIAGTLPTWTGSGNYASSSTDYYTTFSASTTYYLYVKDDGTLVISDIAPYWRPDLRGHYHHHNPWRCVAVAATDGSSNWTWISTLAKVNGAGPRSEICVDTGNGFGATNTKVLRFSNIRKNVGNAITYADDSNLGATARINEDGLYYVSVSSQTTGGNDFVAVVVNGTALTTAAGTMTYAQGKRAAGQSDSTNSLGFVSWTGNLNAGDIVYPCTDGSATVSATNNVMFTVTKVSD